MACSYHCHTSAHAAGPQPAHTAGPVTVPFVLALGLGYSKAADATEGFGILTAASVAPIISVLLTNLFRR